MLKLAFRPMKILRLKPLPFLTSLALAFSLSSCGKKDATPPATSGTAVESTSTVESTSKPAVATTAAAQPALVDQASKLGFAGKLPANTEFYFGSVNFKGHVEALKKSSFWKEVSSFMDDKTPAPTAGDTSMAALKELWGDDFFIAGAKGMTRTATWLVEFNHVYNEFSFRSLMTGGMAGMETGKTAAPNPMIYIQALLQNPQQLERVGKLIDDFELMPMLIGFKVQNPAEFAKQLIPDSAFKDMPKDKFTLSTIKTPDGSNFQVLSTEGSKLLPDDKKKEILSSMPPGTDEKGRKEIEKALSDLQSKKMAVAWGAVGDYLVFACGKNLDHLNFTTSPAQSLLSKPEMVNLAPHVAKNLLGIVYADGSMTSAMVDPQPITPMLRGVIGAMKENKTFGEIGVKLGAELEELSTLEAAVCKRDMTTMTAALWWDRGLHAESYGGPRARAFQNGLPLKYARFVDQPGVILGMNYQRNKAFEKASRDWMEKLMGMLYTGTQELDPMAVRSLQCLR